MFTPDWLPRLRKRLDEAAARGLRKARRPNYQQGLLRPRLERLKERTLLSIGSLSAADELISRAIPLEPFGFPIADEPVEALPDSSPGAGTVADYKAALTWTAPAALNTNAPTDSGGDGCPQVTTDSVGNWVAVWSSGDSLGGTIGTDGDILFSRSTDAGQTWTAPRL